MVAGSSERYLPLKSEGDGTFDSDSTSTLLQDNLNEHRKDLTNLVAWYRKYGGGLIRAFVQSTILVAVALIFFLLGRRLPASSSAVSSSWDDVVAAIRTQPQQFDPHFVGPPSAYQGEPSPELDAKWNKLTGLRNFGVDRDTLVKAGKAKANVQFPNTSTYQAGLEAFHQLHCLNYIRMYTERSYYRDIDYDMIGETDKESKDHKDHCVEILRQRLTCIPDLQIYTYHWESNSDLPFANLRTNHQCVDWSNFFRWAEENAVTEPPLHKPAGADTLTEEDKWGL